MPNERKKVYQVQISNRASKALEKIAYTDYVRIVERIRNLAINPRPNGCKKLKGRIGYRIRVGNYRIVYDIEDDKLVVLIIDIGYRKDIYN